MGDWRRIWWGIQWRGGWNNINWLTRWRVDQCWIRRRWCNWNLKKKINWLNKFDQNSINWKREKCFGHVADLWTSLVCETTLTDETGMAASLWLWPLFCDAIFCWTLNGGSMNFVPNRYSEFQRAEGEFLFSQLRVIFNDFKWLKLKYK